MMIAIDLSKQQAFDDDLNTNAIQKINFTPNLDQRGDTMILFITKEAKETILDFSQRTVRVLLVCNQFSIVSFIKKS